MSAFNSRNMSAFNFYINYLNVNEGEIQIRLNLFER